MLTNKHNVFFGGGGDAPSDTKMYSSEPLPWYIKWGPHLILGTLNERKSHWKGAHLILSSRPPIPRMPGVLFVTI